MWWTGKLLRIWSRQVSKQLSQSFPCCKIEAKALVLLSYSLQKHLLWHILLQKQNILQHSETLHLFCTVFAAEIWITGINSTQRVQLQKLERASKTTEIKLCCSCTKNTFSFEQVNHAISVLKRKLSKNDFLHSVIAQFVAWFIQSRSCKCKM